MGYCGPMGYGVDFPANRLRGQKKLWDKRGYGLRQVWVKRGLTVLPFPGVLDGTYFGQCDEPFFLLLLR